MGYDLQVGERGQMLSGGQRQAIALARALLTDPPILMLDEPTSAMDMGSERQFIRRLGAVLEGGRTLLVTTHRGTLLQVVDRLIVLDEGRIIADGPRDKVLARLRAGNAGAEIDGGPPRSVSPAQPKAEVPEGSPTEPPQKTAERPRQFMRIGAKAAPARAAAPDNGDAP